MDLSWSAAAGVTVVDRGDPDLALNTRELPSPTGIRNEIEIDESGRWQPVVRGRELANSGREVRVE